jgi:hypothetical protein
MLEKIGKNINKIFLSLILIFLFIFLGYQCGNKNSDISEVTKNTSDTTSVHKRDTILPKDTVFLFKDKPVPYPVYIHDTLKVLKPIDSLDLHRFFVYNDSIEDANIKIYSKIVTQGRTLNSFKPSYKLKVPLIIKDSTVVKIDSLVYKPYKYEIHAGGIVGFKVLAPVIEMSIDKGTYGAGYDILNKSIIFTAKYRLHGWTPKSKKKK